MSSAPQPAVRRVDGARILGDPSCFFLVEPELMGGYCHVFTEHGRAAGGRKTTEPALAGVREATPRSGQRSHPELPERSKVHA